MDCSPPTRNQPARARGARKQAPVSQLPLLTRIRPPSSFTLTATLCRCHTPLASSRVRLCTASAHAHSLRVGEGSHISYLVESRPLSDGACTLVKLGMVSCCSFHQQRACQQHTPTHRHRSRRFRCRCSVHAGAVLGCTEVSTEVVRWWCWTDADSMLIQGC